MARPHRTRQRAAFALVGAALMIWPAYAQQPAAVEPPPSLLRVEPTDERAALEFFNRPLAVFRSRVLGRAPAERAESARRRLDELTAARVTGPVQWRVFSGGAMISVADRDVIALTTLDVDQLAGESVENAAAVTAARLAQALEVAVSSRRPLALLRSAAAAVALFAVGVLLLWAIAKAHRRAAQALVAVAERTVTRSGLADVASLRASRLLDVERWLVAFVALVLQIFVVYTIVGLTLRRFPYTEPWGNAMRGFLIRTLENLGLGLARAMPGVVTIVIIAAIAKFVTRLIAIWFAAVEEGRVKPVWLHAETAQPTRRITTALVWVFAVVVAYPYFPGSGTDAFKGVSVFVGLMVTFGSSGLVNQVMSGFVITYSRALRLGDFVRVGDVEGTVTHLGILSTKVRTIFDEEVTIPNAVVVGQNTTDFSRYGDGVQTRTSVTIGYDAPWRQVQSLLLLAAERTPGLRPQPAPAVLQTGLEDFYVKYTLLVCLERQESRALTLHTLHANIQDLFNEYGVQIMSPNYLADPAAPKVVARKDWFAAPAAAEGRPPGPLDDPLAARISSR